MSEELERTLGTGAQHLSQIQVSKAVNSAPTERAAEIVTEKATDVSDETVSS